MRYHSARIVLLGSLLLAVFLACFGMKQYESRKNQSYVGTEEQDSAAYLGTPLYSDMPIEGYENPAPQLVLYHMKKTDLGKVNMDALRRQYRSNKSLLCFVFEDDTALLVETSDGRTRFASWNPEKEKLSLLP
jgi:lipoprotein